LLYPEAWCRALNVDIRSRRRGHCGLSSQRYRVSANPRKIVGALQLRTVPALTRQG